MDPVVLVAGDDDLMLLRETERVVAGICGADDGIEVEHHDTVELDHLPELRTTSLFGTRTCVVLRGVEGVTGALKSELEEYLADPSPDAALVLVARGTGRIPRIVKLAKEHGRRVDVQRPADWDDRAWDTLVADEFARHGRRAETAAVTALRAHAGTDPSTIASQVASVCAVAGAVDLITAEHVEEAVEGTGRASGFAVADAVAERDPGAAIVALRGALDSGEAPLALLGALVFRFRQLLQVRAGASAGQAGTSPGQHRRLQAIASRFGPGELAWCHDRLARLDLELKGSDLPDSLVIELAVIELASPAEHGAPWNPAPAG